MARLRAAGCVFAEDEARLLRRAAAGSSLEALVDRRVAGEPLEHLLGWVEFCGLRLAVGPGVFVPRRRTERLARLAAGFVLDADPWAVVVELCCGVAPVAAMLLALDRPIEMHAADVDPVAARYARLNLGDRATVTTGDLVDALPAGLRGRIDVLAVNTPYVPTAAIDTMPAEARDHEPRAALDGGPDGLDVQRRLAALAPVWLAPGGHVLVEVGREQAAASSAIFAGAGLLVRVDLDDAVGATVVVARRRAMVDVDEECSDVARVQFEI